MHAWMEEENRGEHASEASFQNMVSSIGIIGRREPLQPAIHSSVGPHQHPALLTTVWASTSSWPNFRHKVPITQPGGQEV